MRNNKPENIYAEMTLEQIAKEMGITRMTVKKDLDSALAKIRANPEQMNVLIEFLERTRGICPHQLEKKGGM
jgi:DNA-directed RNA polymerase sigma subunit (sigma70/sigma32)